MKKIIIGIILIFICITIILLTIKREGKKQNMDYDVILTANNYQLKVNLEDNTSTRALVEYLKKDDLVIQAHDYGNFEKVGSIGFNLPTNDTKITTTPGDLILYQGNQITLYYDQNTWSFTKLGHIDISKEELIKILGDGDVNITLSLITK